MAGAAIYLDCYQTAKKKVTRVPSQVMLRPGVMILAAVIGVIAVGIFLYVSGKLKLPGQLSPLDTVLSMKIDNPYLLAPYVGFMTLVIIRSKVLDIKNASVGFEYIYTEVRFRALVRGFTEWGSWRNEFISAKRNAAFAYPNYFSDLEIQLDDAAKLEDQPSETGRALAEVGTHKPPMPVDSVTWDLYYRTLTRLALDTLGPAAFKHMPGFK